VTTLDAFNILVGALSGSFVLQEIYHSESGTIVLFFLSIILILMGLLALVQFWPGRFVAFLGDGDTEIMCGQPSSTNTKEGSAPLIEEQRKASCIGCC